MSGLADLGASSCGIWTRREALGLLSAGQTDAYVRSGTWQVPWRGVYADAGQVLGAEQRAWAAVLAAGGAVDGSGGRRLRAVASGRTAARLWRLPLVDDEDPATGACDHRLDDVTVDRNLVGQQHRGRSLLPRHATLARDDVVQVAAGLWVTTPARTLLDCGLLLTHDALVCAVDAALHRHLVQRNELLRRLHRRPGTALLRRAVTLADARTESPPETLTRLLLLPHLPRLEPQVELHDDVGRLVARFDLGDRQARSAVEADGKAAHAGPAMVAKDRRRDRRTEDLGWRTERLTWWELRREQAALVERVVTSHADHPR